MKTYIGIDNGVTGSIGIITPDDTYFYHTPIFIEQSYTKTKKNISRIAFQQFKGILEKHLDPEHQYFCLIERPLVNPSRFDATLSAMRALEATLIVVEALTLSYQYIDSKEWQKVLLPAGIQKEELKKASLDIGKRLFPKHKDAFKTDADGMLIAEYAKRRGF